MRISTLVYRSCSSWARLSPYVMWQWASIKPGHHRPARRVDGAQRLSARGTRSGRRPVPTHSMRPSVTHTEASDSMSPFGPNSTDPCSTCSQSLIGLPPTTRRVASFLHSPGRDDCGRDGPRELGDTDCHPTRSIRPLRPTAASIGRYFHPRPRTKVSPSPAPTLT